MARFSGSAMDLRWYPRLRRFANAVRQGSEQKRYTRLGGENLPPHSLHSTTGGLEIALSALAMHCLQ